MRNSKQKTILGNSDKNIIDINKSESLSTNIIIGLQHVLTLLPSSIAVPLIIGNSMGLDEKTTAYLVAANLFVGGITIIIQVIGVTKFIGSRLPIVLGAAFAPLSPMIAVGNKYDLPTLFGAIIVSGFVMFIFSSFIDTLSPFFPPIVVGCFVTIIGITLAPTAFADIAGGQGSPDFGEMKNIILGVSVLLIVVLVNHFGKGIIRSISLLIGLGVGTLLAIPLNMLDLTSVADAKYFEFITPFHFGLPKFQIDAIFVVTLFCLINMIQCLGVYAFLDNVLGTKTNAKIQANGMRGQSFAQIVSGIFNGMPSGMLNENVGVIKLTGIGAKSTVFSAGVILLICGLVPKLSAIITVIPKPVIGGATLALFGTVSAAGVSILSSIDYSKNQNSLIIGTGLALGVGVSFTSNAFQGFSDILSMLFGNGLFVVAFVTIILNAIFNNKELKEAIKKNKIKKSLNSKIDEIDDT